MEKKIVSLLFMFMMIFTVTCYAAPKNDKLTAKEIRALMWDAQARKKTVELKLKPNSVVDIGLKTTQKNRSVFCGKVLDADNDSVTLEQSAPGAGRWQVTVRYEDIDAIKFQSPVAKVFKDVGKYSLFGGEVIIA